MEAKLGTKLVAALVLMAALNFQSCKNYDDGPFTLVPPKKRLVGKWELESSGSNFSNDTQIDVEFEDDNDFQFNQIDSYGNQYNYSGEWEFEDNKETIKLDLDNASSTEWEIEKLTKQDLKVETEYGYKLEFEKD